MDPIVKLLEEDVDETMHSGADVDAFTAALNRDIGGALPQSEAPKSKQLPQKSQTSGQQNPNFENKAKTGPVTKPPEIQVPRQQMQTANQQLPGGSPAEKKTPKAAPTIPFQMLMPILRPHLDKDRDMQLQQIFTKLRSNEVSKEDFLRVIRNIVGDQMLRQAAHTVHMQMQAQAAKASAQQQQPTPNPNPNSSTTPPSSNPNPNPNNYSLLSQTSSSSSSYQKVSLGSSPSAAHLQTSDIKTEQPNKRGPQPMQTVNRPPHQQHMFGPSYPPRPPITASTPQQGQVAGGNWPRGVGSTFGPAFVKQEQSGGPPPRDDFLGKAIMRSGALTGPGPISGPQATHAAEPTLQTPNMAPKSVKKPSVGQKKPIESAPGTSPPASKKQKTGGHLDQSIDQLNDVTAVSGVNLREEEEQLLSAPKEDSRISEATRRVVQEEEERLILQKGPLHKKLMEILAKSNLSIVGTDVERCLSMCVEERLKGIIGNLVRISKQRVDVEKNAHRVIVTSDVHKHIMTENKKAKDEWDQKQAEEAEKLKKQNEVEGTTNTEPDKDKDENRSSKNVKVSVNKEDDDKMRTTAANVAARAAVGGDDMLSKWQMMAEQARQKREGLDSSSNKPSSSDAGKSISVVPKLKESERGKGDAMLRRMNKGVVGPGGGKVARSVGLRDVVAVLEREPGMGKSGLLYKLYERLDG